MKGLNPTGRTADHTMSTPHIPGSSLGTYNYSNHSPDNKEPHLSRSTTRAIWKINARQGLLVIMPGQK